MATIDLPAAPAGDRGASSGPLWRAVSIALRAPSIFNTQPWRWRLRSGNAWLSADRTRQLANIDPDGRLLTVSCGVALHHAGRALAAIGHRPDILRWPDPDRPDLLARLSAGAAREPTPEDVRALHAMLSRRTDRRPSAQDVQLPGYQLDALRDAVEAHGVHLHVVREEQLPVLAVAAAHAAQVELADPELRDDLDRWTHRSPAEHDGITADTVVASVARRVPQRPFLPDREAQLSPGTGSDRSASYAVLFTDADDRQAWLAAGEALSALLIDATQRHVSVNPISSAVEVAASRAELSGMLCHVGYPVLALRLALGAGRPPRSPRRAPSDVIDT
ncbi:NAD(P)H nitroreductase [Actinocatenispora thailandica]|uniref:NAD(P)H nitroreductase n=1 Tax=Actinocatenispora thailandica TaxID=227318 RepID=A0A7R7DLY2_9ACTN|nr:nitroreductase [Actinocatenispora thailandica]BCJ34032.1 NAD(P)H nitroreductase [Actinocatenispora thailandica]